jgi:septum formation protein
LLIKTHVVFLPAQLLLGEPVTGSVVLGASLVMSAVALVRAGAVDARLSISRVRFRELDEDEIAAYWATGEPADKAGAYAIQGLGAVFIERLTGSYSGVMGLPLFETAALLKKAGLRVLGAGPPVR